MFVLGLVSSTLCIICTAADQNVGLLVHELEKRSEFNVSHSLCSSQHCLPETIHYITEANSFFWGPFGHDFCRRLNISADKYGPNGVSYLQINCSRIPHMTCLWRVGYFVIVCCLASPLAITSWSRLLNLMVSLHHQL